MTSQTPPSLEQALKDLMVGMRATSTKVKAHEARLNSLEGRPESVVQVDEIRPRGFEDFEGWLDWLFQTYYLKETTQEQLAKNTALQEEFKALHSAYLAAEAETSPSFTWIRWHESLAGVLARAEHHANRRRNLDPGASDTPSMDTTDDDLVG